MATYAFASGVATVAPYGQLSLFAFSGTWAASEYWKWLLGTTDGDLTLGLGNFNALTPTCLLTFKNRVYAGLGSRFLFSDIDLPTQWEEQNPGAGFIEFLNQYGGQDAVKALGILQSRLAVLGRKSVQIWVTDADPTKFSLAQALDNIGTFAPLSVAQLGDYDVLFLDDTGVRSLRAREVTLNAYVDDLGLPIDSILQSALAGYDGSAACAVVEPSTKRYWLFLKDTIYVLSLYRSAKIAAWSTYLPTYAATAYFNRWTNNDPGTIYVWTSTQNDETTLTLAATITTGASQDSVDPTKRFYVVTNTATQPSGNTVRELPVGFTGLVSISAGFFFATLTYNQQSFTPEKFVVYNGQVYCRATNGKVFLYGGTSNSTYDDCVATVKLPYLDHGQPTVIKTSHGLDAAFSGQFDFSIGMDPYTDSLEHVLFDGSTSTPSELKDSSYDKGAVAVQMQGTHFQIKAVSWGNIKAARLSSLTFKYMKGKSL